MWQPLAVEIMAFNYTGAGRIHVGGELAALNCSCQEGVCKLANPGCALAGASLPEAAPGSGAVHPADAWAGRERWGWQLLFPA